jgi:hypothetical protein
MTSTDSNGVPGGMATWRSSQPATGAPRRVGDRPSHAAPLRRTPDAAPHERQVRQSHQPAGTRRNTRWRMTGGTAPSRGVAGPAQRPSPAASYGDGPHRPGSHSPLTAVRASSMTAQVVSNIRVSLAKANRCRPRPLWPRTPQHALRPRAAAARPDGERLGVWSCPGRPEHWSNRSRRIAADTPGIVPRCQFLRTQPRSPRVIQLRSHVRPD